MGRGEEMDGCGKFIKFSMFLSNFIIFLGGLVVFGLGLWIVLEKSFFTDLLGTNLYLGAAYTLIATSLAVCIVTFFGCLGTLREVRCMLLTYFILLFLIFVTMLLGGILGYVFRERVQTSLKHEMFTSLKFYGNSNENGRAITKAWDITQETLHCCGVNDARDWGFNIPESCCIEPVPGKRQPCRDINITGTRYNVGCLNVTIDFIKENAHIISSAGIAVAFLMLLGMIFSCVLFKIIK